MLDMESDGFKCTHFTHAAIISDSLIVVMLNLFKSQMHHISNKILHLMIFFEGQKEKISPPPTMLSFALSPAKNWEQLATLKTIRKVKF